MIRDFARGVMPSLVPGRIAFGRIGDGVLVYDWDGAEPVFQSGGGMRGDPDLSPDGLFVGYFDANDQGVVIEIATGRVVLELGVVRGNHSIRLSNTSAVYQKQYDGVYERRYDDPTGALERRLGDFSPTGIAYLMWEAPGYVSTKQNSDAALPMLNPSQAGSLIAGSPSPDGLGVRVGGQYVRLDPGKNWLDCRVLPNALATWSPERGVCRLVTDIQTIEDVVRAFPGQPAPDPPPPSSEPEPRSEPIRSGKVIEDTLAYVLGSPSLFPRDGTHELDQVLYPAEQAVRFVKFGKGNAHETWRWDAQFIKHWEDASHHAYHFTDGRWLRRRWTVGEAHAIDADMNRRVKYTDDCGPAGDEPFAYRTWLKAYYPRYWCGPDLGEREAIVLVYWTGRAEGRHYEHYVFAKGAGWIRWEYIDSMTDARDADADFHLVGGPTVPPRGSCRGLPPIVNQPEEPMPIPSLLQIVQDAWTKYGGAGPDGANEIAWRGNGNSASGPWGVSYLSSGLPQPRTGKKIAPTVVHYSEDPAASREDGTIGTVVTVFAGGPVWQEAPAHGDPDRNWLPPVEPLGGGTTPPPPLGTLEARVSALEARVTALEGGTPPPPPPGEPDVPSHDEGVATVTATFQALGEPHTVDGAFEVAKRVAWHYRARGGGLVKGPQGGENIAEWHGQFFRAGRVSFSGQTVKILTDVPTTNGPGWSVDDFEPELFVAAMDPAS